MTEILYERQHVGGDWTVLPDVLLEQIQAAMPGTTWEVWTSLERVTVKALAGAYDPVLDRPALDALVADHVAAAPQRILASARAAQIDAVNRRTRELIERGFEHPPGSGQVFSLSETAQRNLAELDKIRDSGLVQYPFSMSTIDDSAVVQVADSAEVRAMYLAGLAAIQAAYAAGNALKAACIAAVDLAELAAVVDAR